MDRHAAAPADGPVFLLIHGVGLSHRSFSRLAAGLAEHGTVLAPDLPGFGRARGARRRLRVEEFAAALVPGLDDRAPGRGRLVVLGHSLGAEVAVEVARRRPDLLRGLVLVGPVVDPAAGSVVGQGRRLARDMVGERPLTGAMVARDYARGGAVSFAAGVRSMLRYDVVAGLGAVTAPLLVLRGEHDPVAPDGWVRRLAAVTGTGSTGVVAGAMHNAVHSHADAVVDHVLAFTAGLHPSAGRPAARPLR